MHQRTQTCPSTRECGLLPRAHPPQANVTIVDIGRTAEGCAAHLAVGSASVGQCAVTTTGLGSSTSPGAQRWVLEAVPGEAGMVYISSQVRCPSWGAARGQCSAQTQQRRVCRHPPDASCLCA